MKLTRALCCSNVFSFPRDWKPEVTKSVSKTGPIFGREAWVSQHTGHYSYRLSNLLPFCSCVSGSALGGDMVEARRDPFSLRQSEIEATQKRWDLGNRKQVRKQVTSSEYGQENRRQQSREKQTQDIPRPSQHPSLRKDCLYDTSFEVK